MNSFVKLGIYSIGSLVFGPLLAIYLTFFGDFYTLSLKYVRNYLFKEKIKKFFLIYFYFVRNFWKISQMIGTLFYILFFFG